MRGAYGTFFCHSICSPDLYVFFLRLDEAYDEITAGAGSPPPLLFFVVFNLVPLIADQTGPARGDKARCRPEGETLHTQNTLLYLFFVYT